MTRLYVGMVMVAIAMLLTVWPAGLPAQQSTDPPTRIGPTDLGGVVTSTTGPEAGVWVIAETTDLPTKFARIVVTDDRGRYVVPDLPANASYSVWVRGYGLVDSPEVRTAPGKMGKGLFSTYATRTPFHVEGGKGTTSKVVRFQLRPDPLAR